jgi:hypothetical protein
MDGRDQVSGLAVTHNTMCIEYNSVVKARKAQILKHYMKNNVESLMLRECVYKNLSGEDFLQSKFLARRPWPEQSPPRNRHRSQPEPSLQPRAKW